MPIVGHLEIESDTTAIISVLTLKRATLPDGGLYTCVTFNSDQPSIQESSRVMLTVESKKNFQVVQEGVLLLAIELP